MQQRSTHSSQDIRQIERSSRLSLGGWLELDDGTLVPVFVAPEIAPAQPAILVERVKG